MRLSGKNLRVGKQGFTLIELMMVVAIMGMLATIVIGSVNGAKASARDIKRVSDIKAIQTALTAYYNDNGHYPCLIYGTNGFAACQPSFLQPQYMAEVPIDPDASRANRQYMYVSLNGSGSSNCLQAGTNVVSYHLGAALETTGSNFIGSDRDETVAQESAYGVCSGNFKFNGNAVNTSTKQCNGDDTAATTPDPCYDVTPDF
jgi:type II secretion system protein G